MFADHRASCQGRPPAHWLDSRTLKRPSRPPDGSTTPGFKRQASELNGKDYVAASPFGSSENVNIKTKTIPTISGSLVYKFPAHAITILELRGSE